MIGDFQLISNVVGFSIRDPPPAENFAIPLPEKCPMLQMPVAQRFARGLTVIHNHRRGYGFRACAYRRIPE
jgi:hypothetical protein